MSKVVSGRKSVESKADSFNYMSEDVFGNRLALTPELKKELKEQGLEGRWVNYKKLLDNQGYHEKGWVAYKRKKSDTIDVGTFLGGTDPDGYIRRGDSILAVKTVGNAERHREFLKARAERQRGHAKEKADELRSMARSAGMNTTIDDRLDENDE